MKEIEVSPTTEQLKEQDDDDDDEDDKGSVEKQ